MKNKLIISTVLILSLVFSTVFSYGAADFDHFATDRKTFIHNEIFDDSVIVNGIDISAWQGVIPTANFKQMKAKGIDFAILRIGWDTSGDYYNIDKYFEANYENALAAGLEIGLYYYSAVKTKAGARKDAQLVLDNIAEKTITYPIYIDLEDNQTQGKLSKATLAGIANEFCDTITSANPQYRAGVYASLSWFNNKIGKVKPEYEKWVAQYYSQCLYDGEYKMWQYSSSGKVTGYSGRLDVNFRYLNDTNITSDNSLANAQVSLSSSVYTYSGAQKKPSVSVSLNGVTLVKDQEYRVEYYKNVKAGTAYAKVVGLGNYTDCKLIPFTIKPYPLDSYMIDSVAPADYTSEAIKPSVSVVKKEGTKKLATANYKTTYKNNVNAGVANITVTGKGNYTGTLKATFKINRATPQITSKSSVLFRTTSKANLNAKATLNANIKYKSSDEKVATVSEDGRVTATGFGSCTITAYCPATDNTYYASNETNITVDGSIKLLEADEVGVSNAELSWSKLASAAKYNVYYLDEETGEHVKLAQTTTNKAELTDLTPEMEYKLSVRAIDKHGKLGPRSEEILVTPTINQVSGFEASALTDSANLTWDAQTGVDGYKIYKYNPQKKKYFLAKTIKDASVDNFVLTKLAPGTAYKYRIYSFYETTRSPKAEIEFATKPQKASITSITKVEGEKLKVKWKKINAAGYKVYYATDPKFKDKKIASFASKYTAYSIKGFDPKKTYYVKVRAFVKANGKNIYGAYSDVKTFPEKEQPKK